MILKNITKSPNTLQSCEVLYNRTNPRSNFHNFALAYHNLTRDLLPRVRSNRWHNAYACFIITKTPNSTYSYEIFKPHLIPELLPNARPKDDIIWSNATGDLLRALNQTWPVISNKDASQIVENASKNIVEHLVSQGWRRLAPTVLADNIWPRKTCTHFFRCGHNLVIMFHASYEYMPVT